MTEDFLPDTNETPTPPVSANTPAEPPPERERLKIILVSSPRVVKSTFAPYTPKVLPKSPNGVPCNQPPIPTK
jgi:hypothetical protein